MANIQEVVASIGIIAFRGLWDRFSGPGTAGAYRRSFLKGIPFIVDLSAASDEARQCVSEGMAEFADLPIFVKGAAATAVDSLHDSAGSPRLFWIDTSVEKNGFFSILRKQGGKWTACGCYLSAAYADRTLNITAVFDDPDLSLIVYESVDVLTRLDEMRVHNINNAALEKLLPKLFPASATIVKVSDLVESAFLQQLIG